MSWGLLVSSSCKPYLDPECFFPGGPSRRRITQESASNVIVPALGDNQCLWDGFLVERTVGSELGGYLERISVWHNGNEDRNHDDGPLRMLFVPARDAIHVLVVPFLQALRKQIDIRIPTTDLVLENGTIVSVEIRLYPLLAEKNRLLASRSVAWKNSSPTWGCSFGGVNPSDELSQHVLRS